MRKGVAGIIVAAVLWSGGAPAQDRTLQIAPAKPAGERRIALVIGNSAYKTSPLRNPVRDARAMSKALSATGFKVTVLEDASEVTMRRAIRAFGDELLGGGVGLFYYAGHGMQVRGRNYLIPVNADIEREDEVEDQALDANLVLAKMDSAKNALNLMILDACRNNPFARAFRSSSQGLAQMDAPSGTLVAFATAPGSVASDGEGENGLYTKHLLAAMRTPGLPIEQVFKEVRIGVGKETRERQVPWESSSLRGNFFFVPPDASLSAEGQKRELEKAVAAAVMREQEKLAEQQRKMEEMIREMLAKQRAELEADMRKREEALGRKPPAAPAPAAAPAKPAANDHELAFWESIKNSSNPEDYKAYLAQYPKGTFAALAKGRASAKPAAAPAAQVASVAPTAAAQPKSRLPKVGDKWQYLYKDPFKNETRNYEIEVAGVSEDGILDMDNVGRYGKGTRAHGTGAELQIAQSIWLFSPYLQVFDAARPGARWDDLVARNDGYCATRPSCTYTARVTGTDRIKTPAGFFDTVVVVIDFNVQTGGSRMARRGTYWYAESAKRLVKHTLRTVQGSTWAPDYEIELVSYTLN